MAASFQKNEKGYNHQVQMPNVLSPDVLLTDFQQAEKHKDELAEKYQMFLMAHPKVFEFNLRSTATSKISPITHLTHIP